MIGKTLICHSEPVSQHWDKDMFCLGFPRQSEERTDKKPSPGGEGAPVRKLERMRCFGIHTIENLLFTSSVAARQLPLQGKPFGQKNNTALQSELPCCLATREGFDLRCGGGRVAALERPRCSIHSRSRSNPSSKQKKNSSKRMSSLFGSGRRIRTLTYGVRVRCATFTQSR